MSTLNEILVLWLMAVMTLAAIIIAIPSVIIAVRLTWRLLTGDTARRLS